MNAPHTQSDAPTPGLVRHSPGITVRPPGMLVLDQRHTGAAVEHCDPVRVRQLLRAGGYTRPPSPAVVVYRLETGGHRQTGVVVEVSVDDYRSGRIRRHEATEPERERQLGEVTEATGFEQTPVMLAHQDRALLRSLRTEIAEGEPDLRLTSTDGTTHTVWVRHDVDLARALQNDVGRIDTLYIADGHHRMAAAERCASSLGGNHADAFTLAALFPSDEMRILGYHRRLTRPEGVAASEVLEALAAHPATARIVECAPGEETLPTPGSVTVYTDGRYYRLWLRAPGEADHARTSLDVVTLDEEILPHVCTGIGTDSRRRVMPVPGGDASNAACRCTGRDSVCFLLHPPSVEQVMAVSDAGMVMPAKSTWFAPKASAGLFVRELAR